MYSVGAPYLKCYRFAFGEMKIAVIQFTHFINFVTLCTYGGMYLYIDRKKNIKFILRYLWVVHQMECARGMPIIIFNCMIFNIDHNIWTGSDICF